MGSPADQFRELLEIVPSASEHSEGGFLYVLLPALSLPPGCEPCQIDALLCPMPRDGYNSRLYFAERVRPASSRSGTPLNWNGSVRILERNWHTHSWRTQGNLRLAQMLTTHLAALR